MSRAIQYNPHLLQVIAWTTSTLKATHKEGLIQRHTHATKKAFARHQGNPPEIDNDFNTLVVDPGAQRSLRGRTVVVLDDFSTDAHGFETARNLLLAAGAHQVYGISVGKFGRNYPIRYPAAGTQLPVCQAGKVDPADLSRTLAHITFDPEALAYYK